MSQNKNPWEIIGWGVIIYAIIRALPFILVIGLIAYLEGYFAILGKFLVVGLITLLTIILSALIEQRRHR